MAGAALLCFLALFAVAASAQRTLKWKGLYVKWSEHGDLGQTAHLGYYVMPLTSDSASRVGWAEAASTNLTTIWCRYRDPRVCMIYDLQGTVAGMQISLPVADIVFPGNDSVEKHPILFKNNMYDTELYSACYYLVEQETLAAGGRPPSDEIGTGLWLQSGADLVQVPRDGALLAARNWTRQGCADRMGVHYYRNMSKEMLCEDLQPYFVLVNYQFNTLQGVGLQMIGRASVKARKWFDNMPRSAIEVMAPDAPPCLRYLAREYGIIFLHVYFIDYPYFLHCTKI